MLRFENFGGGGSGGGITGTGTPPYLPIWTSPNTLGDSKLYQPSDHQLYNDTYNEMYFILDEGTGANPIYAFWECDGDNITDDSFAYYGFYFQNAGTGNNYSQIYLGNSTTTTNDYFDITLKAWQGNVPYRRVEFKFDGYEFLSHEYYNSKTNIFNFIDYQAVPLNEDSYNVLLGGQKYYGFGAGGTTGAGKFFGNVWASNQPYVQVSYTFDSSNIVSGLLSNNRFNMLGGFLNTPYGVGINAVRSYSAITAFNSFDVNGFGGISDVAGIQVLGLYANSYQAGKIIGITNYYGLLINPSDEYGGTGTWYTISNRYGIVQAGSNDKNVFYGSMRIFGNLAFFGGTPQPQYTTASPGGAWVHNAGGTNIKDVDTCYGYTLDQIVQALKNYGLLQ